MSWFAVRTPQGRVVVETEQGKTPLVRVGHKVPILPTHDSSIERAAQALNDEWAAGSQGARWHALEEIERERWREAVRVVIWALGKSPRVPR